MLHRSLLFRYLLIIVAALLFVPVVIPLTIAVYSIFAGATHTSPPKEYEQYSSIDKLEILWHEEARKLLGEPRRILPSGCRP